VRSWLIRGTVLLLVVASVGYLISWALFPNDRTPEGAYYRVVKAVNQRDARALFPYLETPAQHAAFSIHHYAKDSVALVQNRYPEERKQAELARLEPLAKTGEGAGVFAFYAERHGWMDRLRRDLSGIRTVVVEGERASVETVRGTRYSFRRRDNGMWGLTLFTGRLVADAEKAARDYSVIEAAAQDYAGASGGALGQ
jgi:hypothetical protein